MLFITSFLDKKQKIEKEKKRLEDTIVKPTEEINEFFIDMSHRRKYYKNNSVMKNQLFELQFMYELTGAGSVSTKNF